MKQSECQIIKKEYEYKGYSPKNPRLKILYGAFAVCDRGE